METRWSLRLAVIVSLSLAGCAHTAGAIAGEAAEQAAEQAPEPFITETLDTLSKPETRQAIADLFASPEVHEATRELIGNVTDGTLAALDDETRAARIGEVSTRFVARVSDAIADSLERDVGPALAASVSRALDASLQQLLDDDTAGRIGEAVAAIARRSTAELAVAVREDLGPAMRALIRDELIPAVREALDDPETQAAIARTTRTLTREAVLGVQDAFEVIERGHPAQEETILTRLQGWAGEGFDFMQLALLVILVILLVLVAWLVRSTAKARAREAQAQAGEARAQSREAAIVALTEAIRSSDSPWSDELLTLLRTSFRDPAAAARLREALERGRRGERGGPPGGPLEPAGT